MRRTIVNIIIRGNVKNTFNFDSNPLVNAIVLLAVAMILLAISLCCPDLFGAFVRFVLSTTISS